MKGLVSILAFAGLLACQNVQAQVKKWTLAECIDYAVTHNIEVKQSDNQIQSLKVQKNTLRNSFPSES